MLYFSNSNFILCNRAVNELNVDDGYNEKLYNVNNFNENMGYDVVTLVTLGVILTKTILCFYV